MEKSIKKINRKYFILFIILNLLFFLWNIGKFSSEEIQVTDFYRILNPVNVLSLILILFTILLEGLLSVWWKYFFIFFRTKDQLPGSRAFTIFMHRDKRIDIVKMTNLVGGNLPTSPDEQNTVWYNLYRKCANEKRVFEAHRSFLLTRDLFSITLLLAPIVTICYLATIGTINYLHLLLLGCTLLFTLIATRNYANAFVCNVLVESLHAS